MQTARYPQNYQQRFKQNIYTADFKKTTVLFNVSLRITERASRLRMVGMIPKRSGADHNLNMCS